VDCASRTRETLDGRCRAAKAGRPLTRETSAGEARRAGWSFGFNRLPVCSLSGPQGTGTWQTGSVAWRHPDPVVGTADGFNPIRRFPPSPAQAGRASPTISERGSVDLVVVLVDCSGCRSRREAPGPSQPRVGPRKGRRHGSVGSSLPASCPVHVLGGEWASEAGWRRQSREHGGGLSMILCLQVVAKATTRSGREPERSKRKRKPLAQGREHSSREGVLVSVKPSSLTRQRRRRCLAASPGRFGRKAGSARSGLRQRASEATSQTRLAVENAAAGGCSA